MDLFEAVIIGLVQGIAEWLPISSEAMVILTATRMLGITAAEALPLALVLHLGTMLAATVFFWQDIIKIVKNTRREPSVIKFYILTTLVSVLVAAVGYLVLNRFVVSLATGKVFTAIIGVALLITALLLRINKESTRQEIDLNNKDALWLGVTQGLAVFPGISRSGSTISVALLRRLSKVSALKVSFIIGIPLMAAGSIAIFLTEDFSGIGLVPSLVALLTSFVVGLLTIKFLLKVAEKINFSLFVGIFGLLVLVSILF